MHDILQNEIELILPQFPTVRKERRGIITSLISGFIGLTYEGTSSFLHHRRCKALHKAVKAMERKTDIQHNKILHLEDSIVMYGIYNTETLEKLIDIVHCIHNMTTNEKLFIGELNTAYTWYLNKQGIQPYAINSLLYLRMVREKYVKMYKEFIMQLCMYAKAIRILAKGYLPISLIIPLKLQEILVMVKTAIMKTNPDYDIVIKRLPLYYDMKLVTFGIDRDKNLVIQFPVLIQPFMQQPLMLYQIETVPVPIVDQNKQADSYSHLQIDGPYIAFNSETYITVRQQELRTCKRIAYGFYCKELFM